MLPYFCGQKSFLCNHAAAFKYPFLKFVLYVVDTGKHMHQGSWRSIFARKYLLSYRVTLRILRENLLDPKSPTLFQTKFTAHPNRLCATKPDFRAGCPIAELKNKAFSRQPSKHSKTERRVLAGKQPAPPWFAQPRQLVIFFPQSLFNVAFVFL